MRRLAGVLTHVIGQMFFAGEGLSAVRALVRRFTRVLANVIHCRVVVR